MAIKPSWLKFWQTKTARTALFLLLAGASNVLALAPMQIWPLQILSLACLFFCLARPDLKPAQAAVFGFSYSLGHLSAAVSWLTIAMTRFGNLPWILALLALLLLCGFLSSYAAVAAYLSRRFSPNLARQAAAWPLLLILLPVLWTGTEIARVYLFTGFPWALSGYAHNLSPLAGYAPVLGVLGLGWLNAILAGSLCLILKFRLQLRLAVTALCLTVVIFAFGLGLQQWQWTKPVGQAVEVRLLQGNIAQDLKFQADYLNHSLALYFSLLTEKPADLAVTPETALPMLSSQLPPDYLPALRNYARQNNSTILLGVAAHDGGNRYANSLLGLSPAYPQADYRYDKAHLVPFGEFIPPGFAWFVNAMQIPMSDFSRPQQWQAPLIVASQAFQPNICYEDLFGEEIAAQLAHQAELASINHQSPVAGILLNSSNLAWYGDSWAIAQHLQISQMRALEFQRPMLRATNTGATAFIDHRGQILQQLPSNQAGVLQVRVQGRTGLTPYLVAGNRTVLVLWLLALLGYGSWAGLSARRHKPGAGSQTQD